MTNRSPTPPRRLVSGQLVVASHNPGKRREIEALVAPFGFTVTSVAQLGLPEPDETGHTFVENAILKARAAADGSGLVSLADDSGLSVAALGGEPGIYSARWAGPDKDFAQAMDRINTLLGETSDRRATFVCALALAWPDGHVESFEGVISGTLCWPPLGENGFGYDPFFVPEGHQLTFGQMDPDAKHAISHRADAFRQLVAACLQESPS